MTDGGNMALFLHTDVPLLLLREETFGKHLGDTVFLYFCPPPRV